MYRSVQTYFLSRAKNLRHVGWLVVHVKLMLRVWKSFKNVENRFIILHSSHKYKCSFLEFLKDLHAEKHILLYYDYLILSSATILWL